MLCVVIKQHVCALFRARLWCRLSPGDRGESLPHLPVRRAQWAPGTGSGRELGFLVHAGCCELAEMALHAVTFRAPLAPVPAARSLRSRPSVGPAPGLLLCREQASSPGVFISCRGISVSCAVKSAAKANGSRPHRHFIGAPRGAKAVLWRLGQTAVPLVSWRSLTSSEFLAWPGRPSRKAAQGWARGEWPGQRSDCLASWGVLAGLLQPGGARRPAHGGALGRAWRQG